MHIASLFALLLSLSLQDNYFSCTITDYALRTAMYKRYFNNKLLLLLLLLIMVG